MDVLVTQYGVTVNPARTDLLERFKEWKLPVYDIHELKEIADGLNGMPDPNPNRGDRVVAEVLDRDGSILDRIYQVL